MSFISKEKTADATYQIKAQIKPEEFLAQLDLTFAKELPKISLPGFRKGKAPRGMVEKRYGAELFFEESLNALLPNAIEEAVKASELKPIFRPGELEVEELTKDNGATFTFTVVVAPTVSIASYKNLSCDVPSKEVTEADISEQIERFRQRNARQEEVAGRAAALGDIAVIDFAGTLDGVAFPGGTGEGTDLKLGAGQFIPGFEEQVVGHNPGESFDVTVTFPESYHAEDLAGKEAVFAVTLHELKSEELPEVDDAFAQEIGEDYESVDDLRAGITKELAAQKEKAAEDASTNAIHTQLIALLEGEISEQMFTQRLRRNIELFADRIQMPLERYLELVGETEESFRAQMLDQAERQVRLELALEKIAELEGLSPTEEEIDAEYERLAAEYSVPLERVKFSVAKDDITNDLNRKAAEELVRESATFVILSEDSLQ